MSSDTDNLISTVDRVAKRGVQRGFLKWETAGQKLRSCMLLSVALLVLAYLLYLANGRAAVYLYKPQKMTSLSGKTTTQCIGRYLIDVPVELGGFEIKYSKFIYGLDADWVDATVDVKKEEFSRAQFENEVVGRISELQRRKTDWDKPLLLAKVELDTDNGKALILRYLNRGSVSARIENEMHMLVGSRYAVINSKSYQLADPEPEGTLAKPLYTYIDTKPAEDRLRKIAMNIKGYTDATKAPEGFCMAGIVMNNKTMGYDIETASLRSLTDFHQLPFTWLDISMDGQFAKPESNLFQRVDEGYGLLASALAQEGKQHAQIRRGKTKINGIPTLEYAEGKSSNGEVSFLFMAETDLPKAEQSLARPAFSVTLEVGGTRKNQPSPLDRDHAVKMWDGLIQTMRLSPANGGNRVDPQTGDLVQEMKVGQTCPKSGVWAASLPNTHPSARNLASYHEKFKNIKLGEPMPEMFAKFMFPKTADADNAAITWTWMRES